MLRARTVFCMFLVGASLVLAGCDPDKTLDEYFKTKGLNRLAYVRDDIQPGSVVLVQGGRAVYADSMFDYVDRPNENDYAVIPEDQIAEYNAVMNNWTSDRTVAPSIALSFVESFVPLSFDGKLTLTDKVTIGMTNAKVMRMKIPTIQRFRGSLMGSLGTKYPSRGVTYLHDRIPEAFDQQTQLSTRPDSGFRGVVHP